MSHFIDHSSSDPTNCPKNHSSNIYAMHTEAMLSFESFQSVQRMLFVSMIKSFLRDAKNSNPCFNEKSVSGKILEWLQKNKLKNPVVPLLANKSAIFSIFVFFNQSNSPKNLTNQFVPFIITSINESKKCLKPLLLHQTYSLMILPDGEFA